jgi:hypothetical protein
MRLSAEKRIFLLGFLGPERVKEIEAGDEPSPEAGYKKADGYADGLVDLLLGYKEPIGDVKELDAIAQNILADLRSLGRRPTLSQATKSLLEKLEASGDPAALNASDLLSGRVVRG